ncbi:hypothetical protein I4F81_006231 [Pyropia yezoensis]|uniref:Uncharacterized protein n=1 Tax=Pyropia yezoensis TaxID=2788 RepID=A0ACC3C0I4_PYRYE|nr:hypothetical protein I4F81_006231 [Neopyropia yezoensis]
MASSAAPATCPGAVAPDAGSSVVDDPTRAPEDICAPEPVSPRAAPAAAKCGACGYQKTLEAGKTHYWSICKLVVDRMRCPAALSVGHKFYTGAGCENGKCPCKRPCKKCHKPGHNPQTIALDPQLFDRKVTAGGVTFNKKARKTMSGRFYVCDASGDAFYGSEARRARDEYASIDATREVRAARRRSLLANFVASATPVGTAISTLQAIESPASAVAPENAAASLEQARCADSGLNALASAYGGALSAALGGSSGVASDCAPGAALAVLNGRQAAAEKQAALRLRTSMEALEAPVGSARLCVELTLSSCFNHREEPAFCSAFPP